MNQDDVEQLSFHSTNDGRGPARAKAYPNKRPVRCQERASNGHHPHN